MAFVHIEEKNKARGRVKLGEEVREIAVRKKNPKGSECVSESSMVDEIHMEMGKERRKN